MCIIPNFSSGSACKVVPGAIIYKITRFYLNIDYSFTTTIGGAFVIEYLPEVILQDLHCLQRFYHIEHWGIRESVDSLCRDGADTHI